MATTAAALAFGVLFGIHPDDPRLYGIGLTVLMTQFSISAMNDWADRDRDAVAHRWRPVPLGRIAPRVAMGLALFFALLAVPGALAFGPVSLTVVLLGVGFGWAYDLILKATPLSFIPFALAFPLLAVWVGLISGEPPSRLLVFFIAGSPLAIAIHVADSLPDEAADTAAGLRPLAIVLGQTRAIWVMQAMLVLGSLVMVATSLQRPWFALLLGLVGALGTTLARTVVATHPTQSRWSVIATALVMVSVWMVRFHG
ncbi:MAG: UbiA family prenyltransferase [Candidatus Dormibacter sp.]